MPIKNNMALNVLITRPENKGRLLAQQLNTMGITAKCQSFFDYQSYSDQENIQSILNKNSPDIIIFVSVAAVTFADQAYPITQWLDNTNHSNKNSIQVFSVGQATQQALKECSVDHVICPQQQNSEGLLQVAELSAINNKNILIVRGDGGREHLKAGLCQRGAKVIYLESYQRLWRTFDYLIVKQWQDTQVNVIVITSNALLQRIVEIITAFLDTLPLAEKLMAERWQKNCLWLVASERIANKAVNLGLNKIINTKGASDQAIITALVKYGMGS